MMRTVEIQAFAKINIGLTVFGKQPSGYHDIESIFQNVDISDFLKFSTAIQPGIEIRGNLGCPPDTSSVYRAIKEFDSACGGCLEKTGISVDVTKSIPSGSGLGGAGADAAATLVALDVIFDTRLQRSQLANIAENIASDVPFFIYGGAAIVRGRGESIAPTLPREDFGLLIVQPAWESKTPEAYAELDALRSKGLLIQSPAKSLESEDRSASRATAELTAHYESSVDRWTFRNDFEPVLCNRHREYEDLFSVMRECGALFVSLSGSGSCFFGVFESQRAADIVAREYGELVRKRIKSSLLPITGIFAARPLARSMKVSYIQNCSEDTRSDKERPCYGSD